MGYRKTLRILIGILKDKTSIIKATLSTKPPSTVHVAVLRATTHDNSAPPPETIAGLISLGQGSRPTACACVEAIMNRLHASHNATVALKCLLTIHTLLTKGSFIVKDQISFYPSFGGRNYLNLSMFKDHSDPEMWELSSWVRWYAEVLEQNVIVSRNLGYYLCSDRDCNKEERVLSLLNQDLLGELDVLSDFVEILSESPGYSRNSLAYEVLRVVGEDYRLVQREMFVRVVELGDRVADFEVNELTRSLEALRKTEDCKERLYQIFVRRNDAFWDLVRETKKRILEMVEEKREDKMLMVINAKISESNESTRFTERSAGSLPLVRFESGARWLGLDRVPLTVSTLV